MAADDRTNPNGVPFRLRPSGEAEVPLISSDEFQQSFREDIRRTLDLDTWRIGSDLAQEYSRIEGEVREAVVREDALQRGIRSRLFPMLKTRANAPKNAGHFTATKEDLAAVHRGLLFNGGVEACDGNLRIHATLPLTIYQIGVSMLSYQGSQGTWCQRLFRRDLRQPCDDPLEEAMQILEGRATRTADGLGELVQKTILQYAERAILLRRSQALWRMGHGNPVTYELLTGGGNRDLMEACINVLRELIEKHRRFVFVASEPREQLLLTIGQALHPWEYAIVSTLEDRLEHWLHQKRFAVGVSSPLSWDGEHISPAEWIPRFIRRVASQVVVGVFRASPLASAQVFYAHEDHADLAAHIVLADSMLQEQRGFPLLIDLARHVSDTVFGNSLDGLADSAYAAAGVPWRYRTNHSGRTR